MPRPLLAEVDLGALRHNLQRVRQLAPNSSVLAVVKANAYGHGMEACALALDSDGYALLSLDEARTLRELGITRPILLLEGVFGAEDLKGLRETRAMPVIHHIEQVRMLEMSDLPPPARIFLKVDTGMHRLGFAPADAAEALRRLQQIPRIGDIVLMTHYACADEPDGAREAVRRMEELRGWQAELAILPSSFGNSAAVLAGQAFGVGRAVPVGDWVRPGLMLYGASPLAGISAASLDLQPVMRLSSQLIAVKQVAAGEGIGYGATFRSDTPIRIGIVACGYADGYPRHAPTGTPVRVAGRITRLLGRVSMDMLCVDLTAIPEAQVGAPVELFGPGLPVDEIALAAGTIPYEILTGITRRVPVVLTGNAEVA